MVNRFNLALLLLPLALTTLSGDQHKLGAANTSRFIGNGQWEWTVFITAPPEVLAQIQCVEYKLHPTFPHPVRVVCDRGSNDHPFALDGRGWGEFEIPITVTFNDKHTESLTHHLRLTPPSDGEKRQVSDCNSPPFALHEHEVRAVGPPFDNVYVYAQEIHQNIPSRVYVVNTQATISPEKFNWATFRKQVPQLRQINGGSLVPNGYRKLRVTANQPVVVAVQSVGELKLIIENPSDQGSVDLKVCP